MGALDILEYVGGRSNFLVNMITDWKVLIVFLLLGFLAFILLVVLPTVMWVMKGMGMI